MSWYPNSRQLWLNSPSLVYLPPQRSNAALVCNMSTFNGGKLPGKSKYFLKKSKDKAVPGKRRFKRWISVEKFLFVYLWPYRLVLCFVTVFPAKLSYKLRSVNALNWYRFFKALTTGCDVGFCVWPLWNICQDVILYTNSPLSYRL